MVIKKKSLKRRLSLKKKTPLKKVPKRKPVGAKGKKIKKAVKAPARSKAKKEGVLGVITHYFPKIRAAVAKVKSALAVGDNIRIKGHTTDFSQTITSMQVDHVPINKAKKGQEIGLLVNSRVREHDIISKA